MSDEIQASKKPHGNTVGWYYHNEDSGWEWWLNHPIESGECTDATGIERISLAEFYRRHPECRAV
jgi:hypothetical protein